MPFSQPETTKLQHQLPRTTSQARQPPSGTSSDSSKSKSDSAIDGGAIRGDGRKCMLVCAHAHGCSER